MEFGLIFILIIYSDFQPNFHPKTTDYRYLSNFHPNTINSGVWPNFHATTIDYRVFSNFNPHTIHPHF